MARHERWDSGWSSSTGNWWGETGEASDTSWSQVQLSKRWGHDEGESWQQRQQRHFEGAWHQRHGGRSSWHQDQGREKPWSQGEQHHSEGSWHGRDGRSSWRKDQGVWQSWKDWSSKGEDRGAWQHNGNDWHVERSSQGSQDEGEQKPVGNPRKPRAKVKSRLFATAVAATVQPSRCRRPQPLEHSHSEPAAVVVEEEPAEQAKPEPKEAAAKAEPVQAVEVQPKRWAPCPKESDANMGYGMGRVDPFSVGYACRAIPDRQPEGRNVNQPLNRVWQEVKVNQCEGICYLGYEHPIEVFRAVSAEGQEQLFTTQGWKLQLLQLAALARYPKKAIIQPKFVLEKADIDAILADTEIPDNFNTVHIVGEDGAQPFSWEAIVQQKSAKLKA